MKFAKFSAISIYTASRSHSFLRLQCLIRKSNMSGGYTLRVIPLSSHSIQSCEKTSGTDCMSDMDSWADQSSLPNATSMFQRERLNHGKVEISPSAYDTAWVAMVPARGYSGSKQPCFPQCLDWIMKNQNPDGSWGLQYPGHSLLVKDSLSSTLACVLALRKWNEGQQLDWTSSGLMVGLPVGKISFLPLDSVLFFPAMINYAKELDLTLPLSSTLVDSLLHVRDSEIRRNQNLEYVAEGLGNSCNWKEILTRQTSNGSLFNSPATTAAALIQCHDDKCFQYSISVLKVFDRWVPTMYPMAIYTHLCMVDTLERLGVSRYFRHEIDCILDEMYRCWQGKEEEISGHEFIDREHFFNTVGRQYSGVTTVLELYRASQMRIYKEEAILEKIHAWTSAFLKQQLLSGSILDKGLHKQVTDKIKNFHGTLDGVGNRRSIELYDVQNVQILKAAYMRRTIHNEDFIQFSVQDFSISQDQYQKELQQIQRWCAECRLDRLNQGRKALQVCYFLSAAVIVDRELSTARMSYAQVIVLLTCLDDYFDLYGSREEALRIIELVRNWNMQPAKTELSEEAEILFTALYKTVNEVAAEAYATQGRCVKHDLVSMWVELLTNSARTKEPWSDSKMPNLDEHLSIAWKTVGCKLCVLTSIHFLGMKLPADVFTCAELTNLCKNASLVCRLLNDLRTFKREYAERVLNSVSVQTIEGAISEEEAILKVKQMIEDNKRKVLRMVYQREGSVVPRKCKKLFWKTCKIAYFLYSHDGGDEFTSPQEITKDMNAVIWEPLEPKSFSEAVEHQEWRDAMRSELDTLEKSSTWHLSTLPEGKLAIGCKWASRQWNVEFTAYGFRQSVHDHYLFVKDIPLGPIVLLVYVDDILITGPSLSAIQEVKNYLHTLFTIKDIGDARYLLGLEIA
ncbi:cis-abienol synthase, chloroplastic-like [Sesamum indicum]|uniref:Cis-abienol synthase, chloroplastic-like n=1 Tax=Sesamum indicum TaxID=4182 RepID=A0A8M8V0L6_SESIN|nr:cis-abienol synthase, chloroplastic-like [Sesamum indicum]